MSWKSVRLVVGKIFLIFAGIFLWLIAGVLAFVDMPCALEDGIIYGIILDIIFIILFFLAGVYCFYVAIRRKKAKN